MFYLVIIIGLLLYGTFKIMPTTWNIMPELIAQGDSIMTIGLVSCIIAAILAILVAIFEYFDAIYNAIIAYVTVCLIAIGINSYVIMNETSYNLFVAIISSLIFQLQFALPIGFVTLIICILISKG